MRTAIYTAIYENCDIPQNVLNFRDPDIDFILFTENNKIHAPGWTVVEMPILSADFPGAFTNRHLKLQPHLYLKDYDFNIYIDGNRTIRSFDNIKRFINKLAGNPDLDIIFFKHPDRSSIEEERKAILKKCTQVNIQKLREQVKLYKSEGFPDTFPLIDGSLQIRKTKSKPLQKMLDFWWGQVSAHCHRDQISFPYTLWKTGFGRFEIIDNSSLFSETIGVRMHENYMKLERNIVGKYGKPSFNLLSEKRSTDD